jgi:hypothetical protein
MNTTTRLALIAALALLLSACGGSSDEDDRVFIDPPDCKTYPERCA